MFDTTQKVEVGNALMYGLGNEVVSAALPTAIKLGSGNIHAASSAMEAATGEGLQDTLSISSTRALNSRALEAVSMPKGEERTKALKATAEHHQGNVVSAVQDSLKVADMAFGTLQGRYVETALKDALPDDSTAQLNWATSISDAAAKARRVVQVTGGDELLERLLSDVSRGFDKTEDRASWFAHARRMDQALGKVADRQLPQEASDAMANLRQSLHMGITNTTLFGEAADIVDDLARALPELLQTSYTEEQVSELLHTPMGRTALEGVLSSLENLANVHERRHTAPPGVVTKISKAADELRDALELFDEVRQAGALQDVADAAEGMSQIASTTTAARWLSKSTARSLAGVSKPCSTGAPQTGLERFTQGYASYEASFEAKKQCLDAISNDPSLLTQTLASSLGAMPSEHPQLFMRVAGRITKCLQYMRNSLPSSAATGPLFPNGSPPPLSLVRDWALKWNTVFHPETVYSDIKDRVAVPVQMQALKDMHPDLYEQLLQDVVVEVGTHFRSVPYGTKAWLDLLFGTDGMAGPMFSTFAASQIQQAQAERKGQPMPGSATLPESSGSALSPNGLAAIQSSVTNKSGA